MKRSRLLLSCAAILMLASGCTLKTNTPEPAATHVAFTDTLRATHACTKDALHALQFYNSETIILERADHNRSCGIEHGVLTTTDGSKRDRIVIEAMTPGVIVEAKANRLRVSFEPGKSLWFAAEESCSGKANRYRLAAKTWKNGKGSVVYDGRMYRIAPGKAHLLVGKEAIVLEEKRERVAEGCRVP